MPIGAFNPFNPLSYLELWTTPRSVFPPQRPVPPGTPIAVKPQNSDPGISIDAGRDSVTIRGTTVGPKVKRDLSGYVDYEIARGMSFTLDIDKAPTVDIFGKTDFTKKNHRIFTLDTSAGWSAAKCAQMLADKVNDSDDFRATVKQNRDGSATIEFKRW